jgi:flavin reductase (DIM6/NTAB) family NADH-FMN oxidoreductase RutF
MLKSDGEAIGAALGRIPSGCSVLTVESGGRSTGLLVSWVQQASFEPPCVTVCIKRGRAVQELLETAGRFLLNIVGEDRTPMFRQFAKGFSLEEDAFEGLSTESTDFGPLICDCVAHLGCRILQKVRVGDHDLYAAEIIAAASLGNARPYTHLRTTGLSY